MRLDQWRGDAQQGLSGERNFPLGDGPHRAGKGECREKLEEGIGEQVERVEVRNGLVGKPKVLEIVERFFEAARDEKVSATGEVPDEEIERRLVGHPCAVVAVRHG